MEEIDKISTVLNNNGFKRSKSLLYGNAIQPLDNFDLFNVLVWKLTLPTKSFNLISSDFGYNHISTCDSKKFTKLIKPCFQEYYKSISEIFYKYLSNSNLVNKGYRLQGFFPTNLHGYQYYYSIISIIPLVKYQKIDTLFFTITPLKKYNNEPSCFSVIKNQREVKILTNYIKMNVDISDILTEKQSEIFELILKGYSTSKIAKILDKKKETIFSYNIRIRDNLSSFFEIEFDNVVEAADYYRNCFL